MRFSFEDDSEKITLQKVSGCDGLTLGITIPRPGTLGQFLAGYDRRVITKLRVIDSIDAEDIATLNALPNLSVLDMENADLTRLPSKAFKDNKTLTSIKLPKTLTTIGEKAFSHCTGLTGNLTIPNSVIEIGERAFFYCTGLTSVTIQEGVKMIGQEAFEGCTGLTGNLTIPNSVIEIGEEAFYKCTGLTGRLMIPNSVTEIGHSAFAQCSGLTSVMISESVTTIEEYAFSACSGLTGNLTIPNSVTKIRQGAFWDCTGLTSVTIPSGVTNIQMHAFSACAGLTTIYCKANTPPQLYLGRHSEAFKGVSTSKCVLYVPTGCAHAYRTAEGWRNYDFKIIETKF